MKGNFLDIECSNECLSQDFPKSFSISRGPHTVYDF